jgi:hypothetical protein
LFWAQEAKEPSRAEPEALRGEEIALDAPTQAIRESAEAPEVAEKAEEASAAEPDAISPKEIAPHPPEEECTKVAESSEPAFCCVNTN